MPASPATASMTSTPADTSLKMSQAQGETDKEKENMLSTIRSECACGKVKINIRLPAQPAASPEGVAVDCHCPACRKYHVAAFASWLQVPSEHIELEDSSSDSLQTYKDTCKEIGPVERVFCRHCYTKLATKPVVDTGTNESPKDVYVNMGGLLDETIPKAYKDSWKKSHIAWQQPSQAVWTKAHPPRLRTRTGMPPLPATTTTTTGSCACGKCQYQIRHVPNEMQHCYCRLCRQCCGSAFQTWIPVYNEDFTWTTTPAPVLKRTTDHGQRHFCTSCGAAMTIVYDEDPGVTWPAAGGLDDQSIPKTREHMNQYMERVCHICCTWKPSWYSIPNDGLERIDYAC